MHGTRAGNKKTSRGVKMDNQRKMIKFIRDKSIVFALIALVIVMSAINRHFLTFDNIINILVQISVYGVVAFAMTFAIICGEFDLSVSSTFALSTIFFISFSNKIGIIPSILAVLAIGCAIGLLNGLLVSKVKINAFIVTMGTMVSLKGIALFYTNGKPIRNNEDIIYQMGNGTLFSIPYLVVIFFLVLAISEFILKRTKFGRNIYATGGSIKVAKMAGINVDFYKTVVFVILGFAAAFGGIILSCRISAGSALYGADLALSVVAAVVIGGTNLTGGKGSALKTLIGMLVVGVLFNALTLLEVQAYYQEVIKGIILMLVVSLDSYYAKSEG